MGFALSGNFYKIIIHLPIIPDSEPVTEPVKRLGEESTVVTESTVITESFIVELGAEITSDNHSGSQVVLSDGERSLTTSCASSSDNSASCL